MIRINDDETHVDEEDELAAAQDRDEHFDPRDPMFEDVVSEFADPGGRSALRAATASNPRNLPCPTCKRPNRLTPKDKALGYQCDSCADSVEGGF